MFKTPERKQYQEIFSKFEVQTAVKKFLRYLTMSKLCKPVSQLSKKVCKTQSSLLPSIALVRVTSSAYSRSAPTGTP